MTVQIRIFCAGPLDNNVILLYEDHEKRAIVIDPSFEIEPILDFITSRHLTVESILFTHGHFDHFAGLAYLLSKITPQPKVGLHGDDLEIWRDGGGSRHFRMMTALPPDPDFFLTHQQVILLGDSKIEVRHTPGHSPGSVVFYIPDINTAIVGDLIFRRGIGRTDLDGGSFSTLETSIRTQVFTLPRRTILIPGHGLNTTLREEMEENPYLDLDFAEGLPRD